MTTTRPDAIHDALERLSAYRFVEGEGLACHGPMAAEALSSLGYDDDVGAWIDRYTAHHPPVEAPPEVERIDADASGNWRPALGNFARASDWDALFRHQLDERPWPDVLRQWVPRLMTGYGGGLTHGLLRTAHAVRAIPPGEDPTRLLLDELARGLASWAAWYSPLPGEPHLRGPLDLPPALERVPRPRTGWTPIEAGTFSRIDELDGFPAAVEALGPPADPGEGLSDLSSAFCRAFVQHRDAFPIGLVHSVTPIAAVRVLLAHVQTLPVETAYARLWQVGAGLVAGFAPASPTTGHRPEGNAPSISTPAELAARAAAHPDPHVVKFTEACLREHAVRPDPIYLTAADDLNGRLPSP